jgi:very-short-patch-repair endonuclease
MSSSSKVSIPSKCVVCGRDFVITNKYRPQKFCSRACGTKHRHMTTGNTKEGTEKRIIELIRRKGRFCPYDEIQRELHITDKTFHHWGIKYLELNEQEGFFSSERVRKSKLLKKSLLTGKYHCLTDVLRDLGFSKNDVDTHRVKTTEILRSIGMRRSTAKYPTKESLEQAIITEIKKEGAQLPAGELVKRLHFDYEIAVRYNINIRELHMIAGVKYSRQSSYNELRFMKKAKNLFDHVHCQYKFNDCKSSITGRRLQFDFYIEDVNTLIEIDGDQHYDKNHPHHSEKLEVHDSIKNKYAESRGIRLIRIPVSPAEDFEERITDILFQLKSGSCKTH